MKIKCKRTNTKITLMAERTTIKIIAYDFGNQVILHVLIPDQTEMSILEPGHLIIDVTVKP